MRRLTLMALGMGLALLLAATADARPNDQERKALEELTAEVEGAIIYTRNGRVRKVVLGETEAQDLGPGTYVRWSPDGGKIAVYHSNRIFVMDADGENRRELARNAEQRNGCPVEFHSDNQHIIYLRNRSFWMVNIESGESTEMNLPGRYSGEPGISADGRRLAARNGHSLYAIDLASNTHRQYSRGCSPGVSPDGTRVMNNVGNHRQLEIRDWDGRNAVTIDTRTQTADRQWNDHHWSNHADYIAAQGEGGRAEAYVVKISENKSVRVTWEGRTLAPDVFVRERR